MADIEESEYCDDCGEKSMRAIGDINSTRLFICLECFNERHEFIGYDDCEHEYDDRNGNRCVQCGKESINYGT